MVLVPEGAVLRRALAEDRHPAVRDPEQQREVPHQPLDALLEEVVVVLRAGGAFK